MRKGEQPIQFVLISLLFLLLAGLFIWDFFALMFAEKYPPADSLVYETCTVVEYELVSTAKSSHYSIYVEEYEKPLEIDSIVIKSIDRDALQKLKAGDTVMVSKAEGKRSLNLYSLSHGDTVILAYEDFLTAHDGNDSVGVAVTGIMSLLQIGLLIANVIHYKETGKCLPMRSRYRPY